jgi:hypothetical protein
MKKHKCKQLKVIIESQESFLSGVHGPYILPVIEIGDEGGTIAASFGGIDLSHVNHTLHGVYRPIKFCPFCGKKL